MILINICIFLLFPIQEMSTFSGYNLRTLVFIPSFFCLALMILFDLKEINYKNTLIPFCYITLLTFAINDIRITQDWTTFREKRDKSLAQYQEKCNIPDGPNWEIPYISINYQQTFKPSFIVIDNKDETRCKPIKGHYQIVPKVYQYDRVRNYDFSLLFTK